MRSIIPGGYGVVAGAICLGAIPLSILAAEAPSRVQTQSSTTADWEIQLDQSGGWPGTSGEPGTHELKAILQPVGEGTHTTASTPYKIDQPEDDSSSSPSSTTITPVQPTDGVIKRNDPRVMFEIDDGVDGSGFSVAQSDFSAIVASVTPTGAMQNYDWVIRHRDDRQVVELSVNFDPQIMDLVGNRDYHIEVIATDALGHVKQESFTYRYNTDVKPAYQLLQEQKSGRVRLCSYRQPVVVELTTSPIGDSPFADNILIKDVASSHLEIISGDQFQFPESVQQEILDAVRVGVTGPVELKPVNGSQFSQSYQVRAIDSDKALAQAILSVDVPEYAEITYRMKSGEGGCPDIDPGWDIRGNSISAHAFVFLDFTAVEDIEISSQRRSVLYRYEVMRTVGIPSGTFDYDAENRALKFNIVTADDVIDLSTTQSSGELTSETGDSMSRPLVASANNYDFLYEDIIEGWYSIQADVFGLGYFLAPGSRNATESITLNKSELIKGPKPEIEFVVYDYANQSLKLKVTDQGTPTELLDTKLNIGGVILSLQLDNSGTFTLPLPQPQYETSGVLIVSDLAGQSASQEVTIHGLDIYQNKHPARQQTSTRSRGAYLPPLSQYLGGGAYKKTCPVNCNNKLAGGIPSLDGLIAASKNRKSGTAYWVEERKRLKELNLKMRSLGMGRSSLANASCAGRIADGRKSPRKPCGPKLYKDMEPPEIHAFSVYPERGLYTAIISDVGTPLNELILSPTNASFNTSSGFLQHEFPIDPTREKLSISIKVTDSGNNHASENRLIIMPTDPPEINLRAWQAPDPGQTVGLYADVWDASGIDEALTRLFLDGQPCSAVHLQGGFGERNQRYGEKATWYCRVHTTEGAHEFSATAVDTFGLRSEASLSFGQSYPPLIQELKILTADPSQSGITVFSALVTDSGQDLEKAGLEFRVDGNRVADDKIFYDPATGYLSVDGPFAVERGFHRALLTATDQSGNSVSEGLSFAFAGAGFLERPAGDLALNQVFLWELQNANGDGLANPGELIRLFFTFTNTGESSLEGLEFRLIIDEQGLDIEDPVFRLARLDAGQQYTLLEGIDLRIAADILSSEGLELKSIPLIIEVTDGSGEQWELDGEFTVYQERAVFVAGQAGPATDPTLSFITPAEGQSFDFGSLIPAIANINIQGRFTTGSTSLDSLEIEISDDNGAIAFAGSPSLLGNGLFALNVPLPAGLYELSAEIRNTEGATSVERLSFEVTIVPPANQQPLLAITNPVEGAVLDFGIINPPVANLVVQGTFDVVDSSVLDFSVGAFSETAGLLFFGPPSIPAPGLYQFIVAVNEDAAGEIDLFAFLTTEDGDSVSEFFTVTVNVAAPPNELPRVAVTSPVDGETIRFDTPLPPQREITILGTYDVADSALEKITIPINGVGSVAADVQILTPNLWQATATLPGGNYNIEPEIETQDGDFVIGAEINFTVVIND